MTTRESFIVAFGDCFNGLEFVGPFADWDSAADYGENYRREDQEYHVVTVASAKAGEP